jgi:hypothetical protein
VIARAAFRRTRVALVAAAFVAFYPNLISTTATLQLETVFVFLTLLTVLVMLPVATSDRPSAVRLVAVGGLAGLVALVRPTIGLVVVALLAALLVARVPALSMLRTIALVLVAMLLALVPWTIRNAVRLDAFVPVATGIGPTLCVSRNPEATGALDTNLMYRYCRPQREFATPEALDVATSDFGTRRAVEWVIRNPGRELRMWVTRTRLAFRDDTSGLADTREPMTTGWANLVTFVSNAASFAVLVLAIVGAVVVVVRRRTRAGLFVLFVALTLAMQPIILYGDPRYRVPAEPFFAMLAAAGLVATISPLLHLSTERSGCPD